MYRWLTAEDWVTDVERVVPDPAWTSSVSVVTSTMPRP